VGLVGLKPATIRLWIMGLKGSYEGRDCDPIDVAPSAPGTGLGYRPASAKSPFRFIRRPKGRPFEDGISPAFEAPKIAAPATRKSIARSAAHRSRQDTSDGIQGTAGRVAENDSYWPRWIGLRRCKAGDGDSLMPFVMARRPSLALSDRPEIPRRSVRRRRCPGRRSFWSRFCEEARGCVLRGCDRP
jgi:hypothetical protein